MARSSLFEFAEGCRLRTCSAEDLFVLKAFANRDKDWMDAEGVAMRQAGRLDTGYILAHLQFLCEVKGDPEIVPRARALLEANG